MSTGPGVSKGLLEHRGDLVRRLDHEAACSERPVSGKSKDEGQIVTRLKCRGHSTLVEKVPKVPTLSQRIDVSQNQVLLSVISCRGLGWKASLADEVHFSLVWNETRCLGSAEK